MSRNKKKSILKIFISHKDLSECRSLENAYRVFQEEVARINTDGLHNDLIEVELQDYQIDRDMSNPNNPTFQSAESLIKDASNAHAIFTLVYGDISPRIKKWYKAQIRAVKSENVNQQIPMPIFWNVANAESMSNCEAFHKNNDSDYIYKYSTLEELRSIVNNLLQQYTSRWARLISRDIHVPTLESNRLKKTLKRLIYSFIFLVLAVILYLLWPRIQDMIYLPPANEPRIESQDAQDRESDTLVFDDYKNGKVELDKKVSDQSGYSESDSALSETSPCPTESPGQPTTPKPDTIQPYNRTMVKENGYRLTVNDDYLGTTLLSILESTSELRQFPNSEVKWDISISQNRIERGIDDGDYFVDLVVSVKITNNITGAALQQLPLFKNERIMSPISYEDAFRQASSEEFAELIAKSIINSIKNEK